MKKRQGIGQVAGEMHGAAKLREADVAQARRIAANRREAKGWISTFALSHGVTCAAVVMAIGGKTWRSIEDPKPVAAFARWRPS